MTPAKIVIDTDVFLDHVSGNLSPSLLRLAVRKFFCYTTVFNAIELFSFARTAAEQQAVEDAMSAVKVLGLNPKNAPRYGALLAASKGSPRMAPFIAGLCIESRLPLLSGDPARWKQFRELRVIPAESVAMPLSGKELLARTRFRSRRP